MASGARLRCVALAARGATPAWANRTPETATEHQTFEQRSC